VENFPEGSGVVDKMEIAGPGFINIFLQSSFVQTEVLNVFFNGVHLPPVAVKKKVVVDFSSPNVAKEMHVGHLRLLVVAFTMFKIFFKC